MNFKILILGAGYGTQLQRDILQDTSQKYSHLLGSPKALLPVGVGGDTLFLRDFNFNKLFDQFSTFNDGCLVTTYTIQEIFSLLQSPL
ncbi:hypothetical protein C2G38_2183601 [Gigaspora rosea]|uniref:Uncharacterized protein n=1 Tax=Gigaspora rosea TaxID=44941 RepID=A0A397V8M9_9GLOM|nr:hypothetical protein C2G38_2183601 [Gigaspora rosea]